MDLTQQLIDIAIDEDIGPGDITTDNLIDHNMEGTGEIISKEKLVLAGLDIAREVFTRFDPAVTFHSAYEDGDTVEKHQVILTVKGKLHALLKGERVALNFLQRLSGIATHVRAYVNELLNKKVRIVDTRKTTPGLRRLEKYAVRMGGAFNHRMALFDGVLIKDNHIAACGGITEAVRRIRKRASHLEKIEVEVSDMDEVKEALDAGADIIMLDNMDVSQIKEAVGLIRGRAVIEVSGNVTKDNLALLAETGVDIISVGALTHSAKAVDLSMRIKQQAR